MNIIDYIILGILGVSVLFGLYQGFIRSVLSAGSGLISLAASFWLSGSLADMIRGNADLQRTLLSFTDASSRMGDLETSMQSVSQLSADKIAEVVARANLPEPLGSLLQTNMEQAVFTGMSTVSEYVSATILSACISIICFVVCFILVYVLLAILSNLLHAVFRLPVLKQMDAAVGGVFGLLRGVLLCFVVFTLAPMVLTMLPVGAVSDMMNQSLLAPLFSGQNLVLAIMNGELF